MRKESLNMSGHWFKRVSLIEARKNFEAGNDVLLLPVNVRPDNAWTQPFCVCKDFDSCDGYTFSDIVNTYAYYNCNSELGRTVKYFISDVERC